MRNNLKRNGMEGDIYTNQKIGVEAVQGTRIMGTTTAIATEVQCQPHPPVLQKKGL